MKKVPGRRKLASQNSKQDMMHFRSLQSLGPLGGCVLGGGGEHEGRFRTDLPPKAWKLAKQYCDVLKASNF